MHTISLRQWNSILLSVNVLIGFEGKIYIRGMWAACLNQIISMFHNGPKKKHITTVNLLFKMFLIKNVTSKMPAGEYCFADVWHSFWHPQHGTSLGPQYAKPPSCQYLKCWHFPQKWWIATGAFKRVFNFIVSNRKYCSTLWELILPQN